MTANKLSDAKIRTLKPKDKTYRLLDADRLYIEVRPSGVKVWRYKYTLNSKESSLSLGEYPAITLAEARKARDEAKAKVAKGINPAQERKALKLKQESINNNTFEKIAKEYEKERLANKSESHRIKFKRSMELDVYAVIGHKDVREVTSADVLTIIKNTIQRVRSQNNHGTGEVTAIINREFIGAVMRYAIATLRADNDPTYAVRDVIKRPPVNHARPLTREERHQVRIKLEHYKGSQTVKNAGLMLLYTMLRSVEIRRMQWDWVDFENQVVNFPKVAMKKNREHVLPLSNQAYNILKSQYLITGHQSIVFSGVYNNNKMLDKMTLNRMLQFIGLNGVTAHDFRATASTLLYEKGYEEAWIEKQLAHAESNQTKATYNHSQHMDQRRKMLQDWADIVDSWLLE